MVCSVAIHLAAFAIADRLLSKRDSPSEETSTPLIVSIEKPQTTDVLADDHRGAPVAEMETANPGRARRASRAPETSTETLEAVDTPIATEFASIEPELAPDVTHTENQATITGPQSAAETDLVRVQEVAAIAPGGVVATVRPDQPVVMASALTNERPRPTQAAISQKQEKMLKKKVHKWTETLHRMSGVAAGLTWKHKGQEYRAEFTELPAADDMGIQRVIVEISTEEDGKRLTSEVHMKRLAFSSYAQFVNRWDPNVEVHNDELDGRFHSNTKINLRYDRKVKPLFHGMVTTASHSINVTESRGRVKRNQIFVGGLQTGVRSIRLPKQYLPFPDESAIAGHQVRKFNEDTRITFRGDGSYAWQAIDSESPQQVAALAEGTTYLVADSKVDLHVKGTVNGKVLVYSPEKIIIEDDLVYEQHPEEMPDSDDYIGLVSDKYVYIAPAKITGPGDLLINAAIYAKRRFVVKGYRSRENALLYLYGSLSVGSLSATEPRYYTRIQFDRRFEETRPPGFPVTDRYEVESWDTTWMVEPIE